MCQGGNYLKKFFNKSLASQTTLVDIILKILDISFGNGLGI